MSALPHRLVSLLVLTVGLVLTALAVWRAHRSDELRHELEFTNRTTQLTGAIVARVENYRSLLRGTRGVLQGATMLDPESFRGYVNTLRLAELYRGIQGMGYAAHVEFAPGEQTVGPHTVWPAQDNGSGYAVQLLEPADARQVRAMGYNMYSDPARRAAMDQAARTGRAAATGKVQLVQETDEQKQAGFLIYLPVYDRPPSSPVSGAPADAKLIGFAFSSFQADDLFAEIFHGRATAGLDVRVYDGPRADPPSLLHASTLGPGERPAGRTLQEQIEIADRLWTIAYTDTQPRPDQWVATLVVAGGGLLLTGLLLTLLRRLERERSEAARHAEQLQASEQAARDSQQLKQAILDAAMDGIVTIDRSGSILEYNPAAEHLFGVDRNQALGRNFLELIPGLAGPATAPGMLSLASPTTPEEWVGQRHDVVAQRASGEALPLEVTVSRIEVRGQPLFTVYLRDNTERRRAEAQISELNENLEERVHVRTAELEDANQQLESFSYSVSHDLRAPARHVLGFSELLARRLESNQDPEIQRLLRVIMDAARRMAQLIDDLLSFSRTSQQEFRRARVSMGELVTQAIRTLAPEMEGRRIEWELSPLPEVEGDRALLAQVWNNLLSNAVKYTRRREVARITISARVLEKETVFMIGDNGTGFDMAYANKLFGVFQRLHAQEQFEGTGIGLANVARIIHRHGGRVAAEGVPDGGATFSFALPRSVT